MIMMMMKMIIIINIIITNTDYHLFWVQINFTEKYCIKISDIKYQN